MTFIELYIKRIKNATNTSVLAENPWFREYWANVAHKVNETMIKKFGK